MTNKHTDKKFVLLHKDDNIFVCCQQAHTGDMVALEGDSLTLVNDIDVGHKLARRNIKQGEKIIKYGASIGSAKADIQRGEHVHIHNLKSDYISSHVRSGRVSDVTSEQHLGIEEQ